MFFDITLFAMIGMIAGTAAGLLGIGGGILVVPGLVYVFGNIGLPQSALMHMASATSLATMVFTSMVSAFSHHQRGAVRWDIFYRLLPGIIIGVIAGILFASILPTGILKIIFGIFLLLVAIRMFFIFTPHASRKLPGAFGSSVVAFVIGGKSGLLGVGGGAITVPFLSWCNVPMKEASGTSAICGVPIAIFGTLSAMFTGYQAHLSIHYAIGYVYWPAAIVVALFSMSFVFVGAKLSHHCHTNTVKRVFAVILLVGALNLIL